MGTAINTSSSNASQVTSEKKIKSDTKPQVASDKEVKPGAPSPTPSPSPSATPAAKRDNFIASDLLGLEASGPKKPPSPTPSQQIINSLRGGSSNPPSPAMDSGGMIGLMDGLMNHPPIPPSPTPSPAPTPSPTMSFGAAIKKLDDPNAIKMMDQLEGPSGANPNNGLFGTMGMSDLANLTPDSAEWAKYGQGNTSATDRQGYIDAAKTALDHPDLLKTVSSLDSHGYFSQKTLDQWLSKNSDGSLDQSTQQQSLGDCFFLSDMTALSQTSKGQEMINNSIKQNDDGSYNVSFPGDPSTVYKVLPGDYSQFTKGDKDMQILAAAADSYYKGHGNPDGISKGGSPAQVMKDLWGVSSVRVTSKAQLEDIVNNHQSGYSMTFGSAPDGKGNADLNGDGHAFAVNNIDFANNKVTYTNPWDTSQNRTMTIDDLISKTKNLQYYNM